MNYEEMKTGEKNTCNTSGTPTEEEKKQPQHINIEIRSWLFMLLTWIFAGLGLVVGFVAGVLTSTSTIEYKYPELEIGEEVVTKFNWMTTVEVWFVFAVVAVAFWAVYCHLANQEETIKELKLLNMKIKSE